MFLSLFLIRWFPLDETEMRDGVSLVGWASSGEQHYSSLRLLRAQEKNYRCWMTCPKYSARQWKPPMGITAQRFRLSCLQISEAPSIWCLLWSSNSPGGPRTCGKQSGDFGVHGGFDDRAKESSLSLWLFKRKSVIGDIVAGCAAGTLVLATVRGRARR